jgi:hypothetical protein
MKNEAQALALENTKSLAGAPLREGTYDPVNLTPKDANLLKTVSKNLCSNTDATISALIAMVSNLKMYKEVIIDCINSEIESIDLETKYSSNPPQQFHSLPGVMTLPPSYDLASIKNDNARFIEMKELMDKVNSQKDVYIKIIQQEYKMFSQALKRMLYSDSSWSALIEALRKKS